MSSNFSRRMFPPEMGRKLLGMTSPRCEMKTKPLASLMPRGPRPMASKARAPRPFHGPRGLLDHRPRPVPPLGDALLEGVAAIVWRLGGLDVERHDLFELVEFGENLLEFFRRDQVGHATPARGHQEEQAPQDDAKTFDKLGDGVAVVEVFPRD